VHLEKKKRKLGTKVSGSSKWPHIMEILLGSYYRHNLAGPEAGMRARWAQRIIVMGLRIGSCVGGSRPDWPCI
jgi:hypothetical protein